jgi:hypothetical protein
MEKNIRKFSLYASYVSFFLRLIVAMVYWKDSLDFENIIHGIQANQPSSSPKNLRNDNIFLRGGSPSGRGIPKFGGNNY